jgi:RNA polymerase sigma factor (sigma-70 family)
VIEDACQFAWSRLIDHRSRVRRDTALGWLATTAVREAFKLLRRQRREIPFDALAEDAGLTSPAPAVTSLEELVEQRERLRTIASLPERQQRLVWLQGLGLSYTEMAGYTGATPRTVERQLLRAKRALRTAA